MSESLEEASISKISGTELTFGFLRERMNAFSDVGSKLLPESNEEDQ